MAITSSAPSSPRTQGLLSSLSWPDTKVTPTGSRGSKLFSKNFLLTALDSCPRAHRTPCGPPLGPAAPLSASPARLASGMAQAYPSGTRSHLAARAPGKVWVLWPEVQG